MGGSGRVNDPYLSTVLAHHRHDERVTLTSGLESDVYYDLREAMLCSCRAALRVWYARRISEIERAVGTPATIILTGTFGGMMSVELSRLGWPCAVWKDAEHGRELSGHVPEAGAAVILVDDVVSTGGTMRRMTEAMNARAYRIIGEIAAYRRDEDGSHDDPAEVPLRGGDRDND